MSNGNIRDIIDCDFTQEVESLSPSNHIPAIVFYSSKQVKVTSVRFFENLSKLALLTKREVRVTYGLFLRLVRVDFNCTDDHAKQSSSYPNFSLNLGQFILRFQGAHQFLFTALKLPSMTDQVKHFLDKVLPMSPEDWNLPVDLSYYVPNATVNVDLFGLVEEPSRYNIDDFFFYSDPDDCYLGDTDLDRNAAFHQAKSRDSNLERLTILKKGQDDQTRQEIIKLVW